MKVNFINALKENGWTEIRKDWEYRKKTWIIHRDTGSWWMLGTLNNPRVFDIPEAEENEQWTINLMEHLCNVMMS